MHGAFPTLALDELESLGRSDQLAAPYSRLEVAWRVNRHQPDQSTAIAMDLRRHIDPSIAARAQVVLDCLALRRGEIPDDLSDRVYDDLHLDTLWVMRGHLRMLSVCITRWNRKGTLHHGEVVERLAPQLVDRVSQTERGAMNIELGRLHSRRGRPGKAVASYRAAQRSLDGEAEPGLLAIATQNLGNVLSDLDDQAGALMAYAEALQLHDKARLPDTTTALVLGNVAVVRLRLRDFAQARRNAEEALDLIEGEPNVEALRCSLMFVSSFVDFEAGNLARAKATLDSLERLVDELDSPAIRAELLCRRAAVLAAEGDGEGALSLADRALALGGALDRGSARTEGIVVRARALRALGRLAEVAAYLDDHMGVLQTDAPGLVQTAYDMRVEALEGLGQEREALAALRECRAFVDARRAKVVAASIDARTLDVELATARAQANIARNEAEALQAQLARAQRLEAVGQLASGIAHDFNNLLAIIMGEGMAIQATPGTEPDTRTSADAIVEASQRGTRLVRRLLAFAREVPSEPRPVELDALMRDLVPMLQTAVKRSVPITLVSSADPVWVTADPSQLEQMALNLVLNARDAMDGSGPLEIRVSHTGDFGCIAVTDTGTGIAPQHIRRIFDPFFTTKGPDRGTGLGLAMVWGTARQLGGDVDVESALGCGTTFTVRLPLTTAP